MWFIWFVVLLSSLLYIGFVKPFLRFILFPRSYSCLTMRSFKLSDDLLEAIPGALSCGLFGNEPSSHLVTMRRLLQNLFYNTLRFKELRLSINIIYNLF